MPSDEGLQVVAPTTAGSSVPGKTTLLMYACSQGDLQQVKRILQDQPTSAVQRDRTLKTALHYCAGGNSRPAPNYSYTSTAKTDYSITNVNNNIIPGGEPGLAHCADLLVMAAPTLVDTRDADGFTPLHLAVISGNMQLVNFLLANGADINALDAEKHSVVHWATVCGETGALGAVLGAGAQVSTPDVHGGYPLHYAAQMCGSEKPELGLQVLHILLSQPSVSVVVEDNDGRQPLLWAASAGSARAVLALVRAGAGVESADKDGLTALHCAASRGHTDTLDTLLTLCGATPDVIDTNGCTALHYSVTLGHADATALLLTHGADPNRQDRKGRSPAHCGCAKGQLETVRQLGSHGANLWLRNARGDLPLHEAAASGRRPLVRWLLDQRPSQVNARNNDGRCPLHLAALNDNADMCKILLDAGAQVNPILRTSKNVFMTPLDCALQRGFRSTAKFLQLHGGVPASRLSNTPSTLRIGTETAASASNFGSGSNIHIRDDVTVFGGSSSESDHDHAEKKDSRPRRRTIRKRQKVRVDLSASDHEDTYRTKKDKDKDKDKTSLNQSEISVKTKSSRSRNRSVVRETPGKPKKRHESETDLTSPESKETKSKRDKSVSRDKSRTRQKEDSKSQEEKNQSTLERKKAKNGQQDEKGNKKSPKSNDSSTEVTSKKVLNKESTEQQLSDSNGKSSKKSSTSDNDKRNTEVEIKKDKSKSKSKSDLTSKESQEVQKIKEGIIDKVENEKSNKEEISIKDELSAKKVEDNLEVKGNEENEQLEGNEKKQTNENIQADQISIQSKLSEESPSKTIVVEAAVHPLPKGISPEDFQEEQKNIPEESKQEIKDETNQINDSIQEKVDEQVESSKQKVDEQVESSKQKEDAQVDSPKEKKVSSNETQVDSTKQEINEFDKLKEVEDTTTKSNEESNAQAEKQLDATDVLKTDEIDAKTNEVPKNDESTKEETVSPKEENKTEQPETEEKIETKDDSSKLEETTKDSTEDTLIKKDDTKQELNIDLSLKKFEESAGYNEPETEEENDQLKPEAKTETKSEESKPKKYRKRQTANEEQIFSSTSREGSNSESETENNKTVANTKEHKSFKVLKEDVAFEVLNDPTTTPKESRRVKHKSKKRLKEIERLNESATSSPEMLESIRSRRKSRDKDAKSVQLIDNLTLPALPEHKRPESNLSAPNLSSIYSDYEHKSGSNSEVEAALAGNNDNVTERKRRFRRRKSRFGSKSAGSDYESSNLIDSGFEPSPRSSRIPKRKVMSERGVNMTSVTQQIQTNIRKYHMERKIFQHLLDLKRLQIRSGQANEAMLVKRAIDAYHNSISATVGAGRYTKKDFTYRSFEQFLYESLRMLQKSPSESMRGLPETPDNPLLCTQSTHRCLHATHAYTGIPCAAYLPKMNHHTMPKIGFTPRSTSSFLPQINSKGKSVTLELCHGNDKQVISLPADRLDHNKRYYVTFTVKGQDAPSPTTDQDTTTTTHRHAKSV